MSLILNIGHALGSSGVQLTVTEIVQAVERAGFVIRKLAVHESDTETTSVVDVGYRSLVGGGVGPVLHRLSSVLGQDCIGAWDTANHVGALYGPQAAAWGSFDPAFFVCFDGTRLQDSLAVVA